MSCTSNPALAAVIVAGAVLRAVVQPMPMMTTVGCVEADGRGRFVLKRATEPTVIEERVPDEPDPDTPLGSQSIRLIGTLDEFGVGNHEGHKVWAKGLLNAGEPFRLLNLVSITHLSSLCE